MRIAILTQPICNNYGGILQNYALQTVLERRGHIITTLNYPIVGGYGGSSLRHFLSTFKRIIYKLTGHPEVLWVDLAKESMKQIELTHLQRAFLDKYLHLFEINSPITWERVDNYGFDCFVVGSDQVWRPRYNRGHFANLFLDFAEGKDVKRIAYAASFGTDVWEYDASQTVQCTTLAKQFDAISVREASGVSLCKNYLGVDATHVLDPTLMLSADDYLSCCSSKEHPEGDFIAVYTLDYTKERMALFKKISQHLNCPLHFIGRFTKDGYPSVESWIEGIANARYVITDSFHGTVFSIIFHRQFVTLGNAVRGNNRFKSLFATLGIDKARLCDDVESVAKILQQPIDYIYVEKVKSSWQEKSYGFIIDSGL